MLSQKKIRYCLEKMHELFPDAHGELNWETPFQLLIAVILSAQATDISVNKATPALFKAYPTAKAMSEAPLEEIESKIRTIGLYKTKAKNIQKTATILVEEFQSIVPKDKKVLMSLPGVGRKTANVVLGEAYQVPGIAVDTHVERVSKRLKFVPQKATVLEVEEKLMKSLPEEDWVKDHHTMIFFGRYHCTAKKPHCITCPLLDLCDTGQRYLETGKI